MSLLATFNQLEVATELAMKRIGIVSDDWQPRAPLRSLGTEGTDDDVPARSDRVTHLLDIAAAI
jgi:hypothetical protein